MARRRSKKQGRGKRRTALQRLGRKGLLGIALGIVVVSAVVAGVHRGNKSRSEMGESVSSNAVWEAIPNEVEDGYVTGKGEYTASKFVRSGAFLTYEDDAYTSSQGIDVSSHNGEIDWAKMWEQGIRFAYVRAGYRGYTQGGIMDDTAFEQNMEGALGHGMEVGVYFFSQAVNEEEAREEARYVLERIRAYRVSLPVFYDPEFVSSDNSRTKDLEYSRFTSNALSFCDVIREAGYVPGIYCNKEWQDKVLDMSKFADITTWFAGYTATPASDYHFEYWQYSYDSVIDGLPDDTTIDMDIRLIPKKSS